MIPIEFLNHFECNNTTLQEKVDILFEAIINWGTIVDNVDNYLSAISNFLGGSLEINKCQIEIVLQHKNPLYEKWEMESITILLSLYNYTNTNVSIGRIINELVSELSMYR